MSKWLTQHHVPDFEYITYIVNTMKKIYPFISVDTIGYSWAGRNIYSISIGKAENSVIYTAATHASEWLTSLVLLRFVEDLCMHVRENKRFSQIDIAKHLKEKGAVFIPVVNPDGVEISLSGTQSARAFAQTASAINGDKSSALWNANARGVDINHNFNAGWEKLKKMEIESGITEAAPRQYGGAFAESELETFALSELCRNRNFSSAMALHSQGEEIFYTYDGKVPDKAELMAKVLSAFSGYTLVEQNGLASHGGFKDWFINEFNHPAFTVEIGKGENPLALEELDPIYEKIKEMLLLFLLF